MVLYKHEIRQNLKSFIIWTGCIGLFNFAFILLFITLKSTMLDMADSYADMGTYSQMLGLKELNIGTMDGFFAIEIGMIHSLGSAMFAATFGSAIICKEEAMHTSEFITTLPASRNKILTSKYICMITNLVLFTVICTLLYLLGFIMIGEDIDMKSYLLYMLAQVIMNVEIGSICYMISAKLKKSLAGIAIGVVILLYCADMMVRVIDDIKFIKYIEPFYYANASDIFIDGSLNGGIIAIGLVITAITTFIGFYIYNKKDLAS